MAVDYLSNENDPPETGGDVQLANRLAKAVNRRAVVDAATAANMLLKPASPPPPGAYLPPGEPLLDAHGEYIPLAHRSDPFRFGVGIDGNGVYEETNKSNLLPFPQLVPIPELLKRWPPDSPDIPDIPGIYDGSLEVFDYTNVTQRARADWLRFNEVPFKLINIPNINEVVGKWASDDYMIRRFGDEQQRVTTSKSNHFR